LTKLERRRRGSPTTSMSGKRASISSQTTPQLHLGQALAKAAVDAEAEAGVVARAVAVDDELARPLDRRSSRLPETYHMATFSPLRMVLPPELDVLQRGAAHVGDPGSASG